MTAPTPASAFLHSATMVKAGVYLLARLYPTLGDSDFWFWGLTTIGLTTALVGSLNAVRQRDLKGILAYATVSWLGTLIFLLGQPHREGYLAALVGIIAHALYKSPLFMVAGAIDHAAGTRNLDRLHAQFGGLWRRMPGAAVTATLAALSMAGVIPFLGFVAKELLLEVSLETHSQVIFVAVFVAAAFTVTAALILTLDLFFQPAIAGPAHAPAHVADATVHAAIHASEHNRMRDTVGAFIPSIA
jgi:NADH:ubiquinone oxidoreductase subunit 5 (subunit L)/multisubunit Na+/H+ antiporter MnhA subunit